MVGWLLSLPMRMGYCGQSYLRPARRRHGEADEEKGPRGQVETVSSGRMVRISDDQGLVGLSSL